MANGWTLERRARQATLIHGWRPWERSTGARTQAKLGRETPEKAAGGPRGHGDRGQALRPGRRIAEKDCQL